MLAASRRFVMNKVSVDLQNCYGIRKLQHEFDFSQRRAYAIYAANGAMKSSFAQTFKDIRRRQAVAGSNLSCARNRSERYGRAWH